MLLEDDGYQVVEAASYGDALTAMERHDVDLLLVDVKLPDRNGFDLCRTLRANRVQSPIIIVTAQVDSHDVVAGLEAGADDYVTKPFVPKELTARVRAAIRRFERAGSTAEPRRFDFDPLVVRADEGIVELRGQRIDLTKTEFLLLMEFVTHPGLVLSREQLLERVWGYEYASDSRLIDAHVSRLRGKIEPDAHGPRFLETVRGLGYRFSRPSDGAGPPRP
jgi:DNA-binding response OmpR family regulator